jgi:hypothetical protein
MTAASPAIVAFTRHAERRCLERRLDLRDVAELILNHHSQRRRNSGEADRLVSTGGVVIAYNWPDGDDDTTALVITTWRE